jgi:hypothetical protein
MYENVPAIIETEMWFENVDLVSGLFVLQYWRLNPSPHACQASIPPLEPCVPALGFVVSFVFFLGSTHV